MGVKCVPSVETSIAKHVGFTTRSGVMVSTQKVILALISTTKERLRAAQVAGSEDI